MKILIINAFTYIFVLIVYICIVRRINLGVVLLSLYAFAACSSIAFYNHELFELSMHDCKITWEPFVYLFITLMIFFLPILRFRNEQIREIAPPDISKFYCIAYFAIFTSILCIIVYFPHMIKGMEGDISENRNTVMSEGLQLDLNPIVSVLVRIGVSLRDITILLFFYVLAYMREKRVLLILLGICAFVAPMVTSLAWSARTIIIFLFFSILTCYLLFHNVLLKKIKLTINIIFITIFGYLLTIFFTITVSRFGQNDTFGLDFFLIKYMGESFTNFNGILYDQTTGILYGGNSFPLFRRFWGLDYWVSIDEFRTFADAITGVPVWIFYLFVGSLYLDFGPTMTFIIAITVCFVGCKVLKNSPRMPFHRLILLLLIYNIYTEGVFYFSLYDEPGNLKILGHIFLYFFFRIDFKKLILKPI